MTYTARRSAGAMLRDLRAGVAGLPISSSSAVLGPATGDVVVVDGATLFPAVLPAGMLRAFPPGSEDSGMRGGHFEIPKRARYRIPVRTATPDDRRGVEKAFEYRHQ